MHSGVKPISSQAERDARPLVGPRPEREDYATRFAGHICRYGDRHRVKSGLTGWAQIHGLRGKTSLRDRVEYDNYYVENWSPWLDIQDPLANLVLVLTATYQGGGGGTSLE